MATNVAASSNGGTATASSSLGGGYPASAANNGDRPGTSWSAGGGWAANSLIVGEWLQTEFNASYSIGEIDVFGLQDNPNSPITPTLSLTSSLYGLKDFQVQYWTGAAWTTVTGGTVTGNNHVWTQFTFTPVSTTKVRVLVSAMQSSAAYAIVVELEAWTAVSAPGSPSSPSPADTATGVALSPTLTWSASGATSYDVYFGTAGSPPLVSSDQVSASYTTGALSASTAYHWKIVAKNSGGSTTGSVWTFTTTTGSSTSLVKPTIFVEAELSGMGSGWTSLTADVIRPYAIRVQFGIQGSAPGDLVASTGTMRFALNNSNRNSASTLGYYSLYHASKRTGWTLGINCRLRLQDPNTGTIYTKFTGRIDAIDPLPGSHLERAALVTVTDWMDEAARWTLTPAIGEQVDKSWDTIIAAILAEMPRQPTATTIDVGAETYPYALDTSSNTRQPALSEFGKLAASEFGLIYVKGDGTFRAESRHSRLLDTVSDWTITESDLVGLRLPSTRDEIINTVRVQEHPKIVDPNPTTLVYDQANVIEVGAGQTKFLLGSFRDPVTGDPIGATDVQAQVSGVDYVGNLSEDGTGTDISSDFVIVTTIGASGIQQDVTNNNASTGYLTRNQFYGRGIYDRGTVQFEARDSVSIAAIGERVVIFDMPYQADDDVGQGAATYTLNRYSSAFAQARSISVAADTATLLAQVLARDISDRLTISETVTGLNSSYFVNGVGLQVLPSGHLVGDYVLAPAHDPAAGLYWVLGTSTLGTDTLPAPF